MEIKVGDYVEGKGFKFGVATLVEVGFISVSWVGGSGTFVESELEKVIPQNEYDDVFTILRFKDYDLDDIKNTLLRQSIRRGSISSIREWDIVKLRDGEPFFVKLNEDERTIFNGDRSINLDDYNDDLTNKNDSNLDIMSISIQYKDSPEMDDIYIDEDLLFLWERDADPSQGW